MLSQSEQAVLNLEEARRLRASGLSYRQVRHQLGISISQLVHIRRALKREKAARTRIRSLGPGASDRDLQIAHSVLPAGLRNSLAAAGYTTLGDLADRLADPRFPGFETFPGIGPHRSARVKRLLDHYSLLPGSTDLRAEVERLFPDFALVKK
jgi:hypothetical protein